MSGEATAGERVDAVLERLARSGDSAASHAAEELVRALMDFYGTGLQRIIALLTDGTRDEPDGTLRTLLDDDVVTGLLTLHDLHPDELLPRIRRALRTAGAAGVTVDAFDEETGVLRLRSDAGCGCPGTTQALRDRVEAALSCHAPEVASVDLRPADEEPAGPALLQIGSRPPERAR